eukprot:2520943-Pyramimonas_sp.AAC.1
MQTPPVGPAMELTIGPRSAVLGGGHACGSCHRGLWLGPLWGHGTLHCAGETHANSATEAFGGAPYGATKR